MKTLEELYKEILANEEKKKAYEEAKAAGKLPDFVKENGCEATAEELAPLMTKDEVFGELSLDELDNVAGGGGCYKYLWTCTKCSCCLQRNVNIWPTKCPRCGGTEFRSQF